LSTENSYSEEEVERIPPRLISEFQPLPKVAIKLEEMYKLFILSMSEI
jgi:hypothetical protein